MSSEILLDKHFELILLLRGERPFFTSTGYERIERLQALSILKATLLRDAHSWSAQLLDALGVDDHPANYHPEDLARLVERRFLQDGLALYRRASVVRRVKASEGAAELPPPEGREVRHYASIVFEVASGDGARLAGVLLELTAPDGSVSTHRTDQRGQVSFHGIEPGTYALELPQLDRNRWSAANGPAKLVRKQASPAHRVATGECLSKIAHAHGIADWRELWDHADNAALKAKRKNPHVLLAGDIVRLPELEVGRIECGTDAVHRITLSAAEERLVPVRLRLESRWKHALEGLTYTLSFIHRGELCTRAGAAASTSDGLIEELLPVQVDAVVLSFDRPKLFIKLSVSGLDPVRDGEDGNVIESGVTARLRALGYASGSDAGSARAVAHFQQLEMGRTEPTGEMDAETRSALETLYGA